MKSVLSSPVSCLLTLTALALVSPSVFGAAATAPTDKTLAVFVQNRTRTPGMDTASGAVRERIVSAFAEIPGFRIVDSTIATDSFNESPNIIKSLGCDYVAVAGIVGASSMKRNVNGRISTVFTLRMSFKVLDANGVSVDGMPTWKGTKPILDAADDPMNYYELLFDDWAEDMTRAVATKAANWRAPVAASANLVAFRVQTSIDGLIPEYESQTKGLKGEQLQELRKIVGCASVELDGVTLGFAPGEFKATPGLHKLRVKREWMKTYEATVSIQPGASFIAALELSDDGLAKWGKVESLRADVAQRYAEAAAARGIKVNIDSKNWRDVGGAPAIKVEK